MKAGFQQTVPVTGWHLVEGRLPLHVPDGARGWIRIVDRQALAHQVPLGQLRDGVPLSVVVMIPSGTWQLSVVVTSPQGSTTLPLDGLRLRAINKATAMVRMMASMRDRRGRRGNWRAWAALPRLLAPLWLGRVSTAGKRMLDHYQTGLRAGAGDAAILACEVLAGRMRRPLPARWEPINQLQPSDSFAHDGEWEANGDDPQLRLEYGGGPLALPAGWYELEMQITATAGRMRAPALYPDYGEGYLPQGMIKLTAADGRGWIRHLVMFQAPVASLRFDPSIQRLRFVVGSCSLRRLSRFGALVRLLDVPRHGDGSRNWRGLAHSVRSFALDAVRHGMSAAAANLHGGADAANGVAELDYGNWVRLYDTLHGNDRRLLEARTREIEMGPLISVLLPVYETPELWLKRCIDSVRAQAYPNWELCAVDDASPSPHVFKILND